MLQAAITSKGQVTIPKTIREALHLSTGDRIAFVLSEDGEAVIKPISKSASDVFGVLCSVSDEAKSIDEMHNELHQSFKSGKI